MGESNQGARFSKDKVHAVFKDYLHELEEEKNRQTSQSRAYQFWCRIDSVENLYQRLGLGQI